MKHLLMILTLALASNAFAGNGVGTMMLEDGTTVEVSNIDLVKFEKWVGPNTMQVSLVVTDPDSKSSTVKTAIVSTKDVSPDLSRSLVNSYNQRFWAAPQQ